MKAIAVVCFALAGAVCLANVQDETPEMEKPGEHHKHLRMMAGKWDAKIKFFMDPENPMEWKGTESAKVQIGGFWLVSKVEGVFMGRKFEGLGILGYDERKKTYVGTWVDSVASTMMTSEGKCEKDGKVQTMISTGYDPMQQKDVKYRQVTEIVDKDTKTFKMYHIGDDKKETLIMEATYTRRAGKKKDK